MNHDLPSLARDRAQRECRRIRQTPSRRNVSRDRPAPRFLGATIHRRDRPEGVEFIVITNWASAEAVHSFSGPDAEMSVVPPRVREMMVEYDLRARHYRVVE
jgi:hypothetical protein